MSAAGSSDGVVFASLVSSLPNGSNFEDSSFSASSFGDSSLGESRVVLRSATGLS